MSVTSVAPPTVAVEPPRRRRLPGRRALTVLLVALATAGATLLGVTLLRHDPKPAAAPTALAPGHPAVTAVQDVPAVARQVGHAVYGAGTQPGTKLELTRGTSGEVWVRYLSGGAAAGDKRPNYLTVGTYRQANALAATQKAAKGKRMKSAPLPGGGLMLYSLDRPTSVYVARPNSDFLVEVYSPDAAQAQGLARGGAIVPLG
ncbi:MAG: hypothetical protein QOE28_1219 [Solirubrobacteraceae bacterium]|nr:hypothetical protein [Solirubrobacteraceae bacterium]